MVDGWRQLEEQYSRGAISGVARLVVGRPVRFAIGGVGSNRLLVLTPEPVAWQLRCFGTGNHRNAKFPSLAEVDKRCVPLESSPRRAEQPSFGGKVTAYSSASGFPRDSELMWPKDKMESLDVSPSFVAPAEEKSRARHHSSVPRSPSLAYPFCPAAGRVPSLSSPVYWPFSVAGAR